MKSLRRQMFFALAISTMSLLGFTAARAQSSPIPFINNPIIPPSAAIGGPSLTLTLNGGGFVSGAVVNWQVGRTTTPLATTFVSGTQLTATVPASLLATATSATITVANPGGLPSSGQFFQVSYSAPAVHFPLPFTYSLVANSNPDYAVTADFNGDGNLDIAVADTGNSSVSILLGNGDGTFQPHVDYPAGTSAIGIAVGDFNGDGRPDIAVAGGAHSGAVYILLGNGDGTFQLPIAYPVEIGPTFVAVGDFNQDGKLDLAVLNNCGSDPTCGTLGSISILLGNGDGSFQPQHAFSTFASPGAFVVADVNDDGKLDLTLGPALNTTLSVFLGNGDGTFQPAINTTVSSGGFFTLADLNGDGKPDLALTVARGTDVLLGNGDGTFQTPQFVSLGNVAVTGVMAADFNGDGKLDLVAAAGNGVGELTALALGNGNGTFQPPSDYPSGPGGSTPLALGDFNNDGLLDTAVADGASATVSILLQTPAVVSPPSLAFGQVGYRTPSPAQNVSVTNTGVASLPFGAITFSGIAPLDFSQTNTCGSSVAPGSACTISVVFTPRDKRLLNATMTFAVGPSGVQQFQISLSGTGVDATFTVKPSSINFGTEKVGMISPPQNITITNTSQVSLGIVKIILGGQNAADFTFTNNCGSILPKLSSCTVGVSFAPTKIGIRKGMVDLQVVSFRGRFLITSLRGTGN